MDIHSLKKILKKEFSLLSEQVHILDETQIQTPNGLFEIISDNEVECVFYDIHNEDNVEVITSYEVSVDNKLIETKKEVY